jgi:arsenate reductase (thioredoxin)
MTATTPLRTLFLCTHNSARSVMAEQLLNRLGQGRFLAFSAGSQPSGRINPYVRQVLETLGYDVQAARSKSWEEFAIPSGSGPATDPAMDIIVTVCDQAAGEACPIWPGNPALAHWGFPDPSSATGDDAEKLAFAMRVYRLIERRIQDLVALPPDLLNGSGRIQALRNLAQEPLRATI